MAKSSVFDMRGAEQSARNASVEADLYKREKASRVRAKINIFKFRVSLVCNWAYVQTNSYKDIIISFWTPEKIIIEQ